MNTTSSVPRVSMDPAARYVGQSRIWDSPMLGKLTSRKITSYIKAGYYGTQRALRLAERELEKKKKKFHRAQRRVEKELNWL